MKKKVVEEFFNNLRRNGMSDDEILAIFYKMFQDDKISLDELEALCAVLGYEFTDEFKNMSMEDKKTQGVK